MAYLAWIACITGVLGAALLASNVTWSGWGFAIMLISSLSWCMAALKGRSDELLVMNLAFSAINLVGIYRWLF